MGYLSKIIRNHQRFAHLAMAGEITRYLNESGVHPLVDGPANWEGGRYIGVFVTLRARTVRMIIQLTDSGLNRHVYNIIPMSNQVEDREVFVRYMQEHHPQIALKNGGRYCKLPGWKGLTVKNDDLNEILHQVQYAQGFFGNNGL